MPKISGVLITKNEQRNIERCLKSLEGIVDEIVVVDSFSNDNTAQLCAQHSVSFVQKEFVDYSSSKNYANSLAQHPFIFSIDADEEVSEELKKSILGIKPMLKDTQAYSFNRLTNYCGKWIRHCGWYPDRKVRLFPKHKGVWIGDVHEHLDISDCSVTSLKVSTPASAYLIMLQAQVPLREKYSDEKFSRNVCTR